MTSGKRKKHESPRLGPLEQFAARGLGAQAAVDATIDMLALEVGDRVEHVAEKRLYQVDEIIRPGDVVVADVLGRRVHVSDPTEWRRMSGGK